MADLIEHIPAMLGLSPFAYEKITVADTAVGLTATTYAPDNTPPASAALITVDTATIRVRFLAGTPTASDGHGVAAATDPIWLSNQESIVGFRAIREGTTSATIQVTYYR